MRGQDVTVEKDGLIISGRVKGVRYRAREVQDPEVRAVLLDYLTASNRLFMRRAEAPLGARHDHPNLTGEALTS
jgi:hypothetical protein